VPQEKCCQAFQCFGVVLCISWDCLFDSIHQNETRGTKLGSMATSPPNDLFFDGSHGELSSGTKSSKTR
jgi:hypothetical protein